MGLRFYEKYLLLFGLFVAACFLLSGTYVYFASKKGGAEQVHGDGGPAKRQKQQRNQKIVRDAANRRKEEQQGLGIPDSGLNAANNASNGREGEESAEYRRNFVKETDLNHIDPVSIVYYSMMMKFAWSNYAKYAWGDNELRPISKIGHSGSIFGRAALGATIVDALDTLYIMEMHDEFAAAKDWVATKFSLRDSGSDLSVFETNIRFVGGLLSAYALSKEQVFVDKAREIADVLLPAFNDSPYGIPMALVNPRTGRTGNYGWASGGCSILSELGSLELEFQFLSRLTANQTYAEKCAKLREYVTQLKKPDGLYPNYLNPQTGKWCQKHVSVGALGDSFYEYLLKLWIFNGKRDDHLKEVYQEAVKAIEDKLLQKSRPNNLWYFAELKGTRLEHKMDHLACFIAGLFALQSVQEMDEERRAHYLQLGEEIGKTCYESYRKTATKIGPESFRFTPNAAEAQAGRISESYYILRPEAIEGWFYLWRVTGKERYRQWCWEAAQAIERHCRVAAGYSGIRNVNAERVEHDDVQQSFFLAETLKYLYLAFSDSTEIPLDQWVFNTEAHPFPIVSPVVVQN